MSSTYLSGVLSCPGDESGTLFFVFLHIFGATWVPEGPPKSPNIVANPQNPNMINKEVPDSSPGQDKKTLYDYVLVIRGSGQLVLHTTVYSF